MAVTVTTTVLSNDQVSALVKATANGDTDAVIAHALGPNARVTITPLSAAGVTKGWFLKTLAYNSCTISNAGAGGGDAANQVKVVISRLR